MGRCLERREVVLGLGVIGAGFLCGSLALPRLVERWSSGFNLEELKELKALQPDFPVPSYLKGVYWNSPFLWRVADLPEVIWEARQRAVRLGAVIARPTVRVLINDGFEPELGEYRWEVLEQVKTLSKYFNIQLDVVDAFSLFHSRSGDLCSQGVSLSSPYLKVRRGSELEQQMNFFTEEQVWEIWMERVRGIMGYLCDVPGIVAWCVGNELRPPVSGIEEKRKILTAWYKKALRGMREVDSVRPILSGLADPNLINESELEGFGLINTIHVYSGDVVEEMMTSYRARGQQLPLVCQEIGARNRCGRLPLPQDLWLSLLLQKTFPQFFEVNREEGWYKPVVTSLGLWQLGYSRLPNRDGFESDLERMPMVANLLREWERAIYRG